MRVFGPSALWHHNYITTKQEDQITCSQIYSVFLLGDQRGVRASERPSPPRSGRQRGVVVGLCFCGEGSVGIRSREGGGMLKGGLFPCLTSFSRLDILSPHASFPGGRSVPWRLCQDCHRTEECWSWKFPSKAMSSFLESGDYVSITFMPPALNTVLGIQSRECSLSE